MKTMTNNKDRVITIKLEDNSTIRQKVYLLSDVHFDSVACDRDVLKKHLDKAKAEDALVIIGGDWFDAMQGKFDARRNLDELRPEYRTERYFDVVVQDSADFLEPYAGNIVAVTQGNHELSVMKYSNTDLADRLVMFLRLAGSEAVTGSWNGWVRFMLSFSTRRSTVKMYYSHNASGSTAAVTRGVLAVNRQAVYEPDADIIWNGHTHTAYIMPISRERLSEQGKIYNDIGWFIRTPGYKRDWAIKNGFSVQKGLGPSPVGCAVITLEYGASSVYPIIKCDLEIVP